MRDSHERIATGNLTPATPDAGDEAKAYAPKLPWKWILGVLFGVAAVAGIVELRERREAAMLRASIAAYLDGPVGPAVKKYRGFRKQLETWTSEAAKEDPPTEGVDPTLRISSLYKRDGAYLRIRTADGKDGAGIAKAARGLVPDAIGRCMGVAPVSLKGFYDQGDFLLPAWREAMTKETSVARLRVLESDLKLRVARDLPNLLTAANASYFLLTVQRGDNRRDAPVDVFMWDTQTGKRSLATRTKSTGALLTMRVGRGPRGNLGDSAGVHDCSIASQVKALAGEPAMEVENPSDATAAVPAPAPAAPATVATP